MGRATSRAGGYYHTAEEQFWRIQKDADGWRVWTKDGTLYLFTTPLYQMVCSGCQDPCNQGQAQVYKWLLSAVEDRHGNRIDYSYFLDQGTNCRGTMVYRAAYLATISYNGGRMTVEFILGDRTDLYAPERPGRYPGLFLQRKRLDRIEVKVDGVLVRRYKLDYDYSTYDDKLDDGVAKGKLTLKGIQACGTLDNGQSWLCLPQTTFEYYPTGTAQNPQVGRNRLKSVANGYGGKVTFVYEEVPLFPYRNRVVERTVEDGMGGSGSWSYQYQGEARNSPNIPGYCSGTSDDAGTAKPRTRPNQEFRGHAQVTVTDPEGNVRVHYFRQDDTLRGKEYRTEYRDEAGKLYREVLSDHTYAAIAVDANQGGYTWVEPEVAFVYVSQERDRAYQADGSSYQERKTAYGYDPALQGGTQYGNLTTVQEYDGEGNLYRTTRRWYCPNASVWIVDRMNAEGVWAGDWGSPPSYLPESASWYYYDGTESHLTCPASKGELTRIQRLQYNRTEGGWTYWDTAETAYGYDSYGNCTSETVYAGYGQMRQQGTTIERVSQPTLPRTTQIDYNASGSGFHLYPERVVYPIGSLVEQASYNYRLGVLSSYTDFNGDTTSWEYDALGRVVKVVRPGDSSAYPTVQVSYLEWGTPGMQRVLVQQREVSGQDGTREEERYFDGLGRPIQVQEEGDGGQEVIRTTLYDALGRKKAEVVPYFAGAGSGYRDPGSNPRTETSYDALGRVYNVVNPDGTVVKTRYNGWQVAVIDENGHMVIRESDALGRLVRVKEYQGTFGEPNWDATPYATTNYFYDVRDLLVKVQDAAGNETQVFYDMLGRKVEMNDPDMGMWTYAYDALGNMTRQADARGQRICFYYDEMNRVVGKIYWTNDSCPVPGPTYPLNVTYLYDNALGDANASNSWGRLRRAYVGSSYQTNGHDYKYDERGRTIEEKVWVDGTSYTTSYSYDAMDRVQTMRYPDGEVVMYGYGARGLLTGMSGADIYLDGMGYTAWGAVDGMNLGGVVGVDYSYYPWSGGNGEGRGRLSGMTAGTASDGSSLMDLRYTDYDLVGNVKQIQDWKAGSPQTQSFTYDELNRLLSAVVSGGTYGKYSEWYAYEGNDGRIGNLTSKGGVAYTYGAQSGSCPDGALSKPHAVVSAGTKSFCYDRNGNQVKRVIGSDTYVLTYDAENRLVGVAKNGTSIATFVYGPGGERVKGVVNGVTTVYVGNHYEKQGSTIRKYYYAGATRVAMRQNGTLYWLLVDHLGSTAVVANASGTKVGEVRYKAWGEDRYTWGTVPTTYRYTGQRWEVSLGLYFYQARWYDPALGRFVQPDTVVPEPGDPQGLNRFAYVRNNPLSYLDPTGRWQQEAEIYLEPGAETLGNAAQSASEVTYQEVKAYAYSYYCSWFSLPFAGSPSVTEPFGSPREYGFHMGVDFGGSFSVLAPYAGTVVYAGTSHEAGMWRFKNPQTGEIREWSVWAGTKLYTWNRLENGLYEPENLIQNGGWEDIERGWSHVEGTRVIIAHTLPSSGSLETWYEHLDQVGALAVYRGQQVAQGDLLGTSQNNGWSTGAHLHYALRFTYLGRSEWLNPVCR